MGTFNVFSRFIFIVFGGFLWFFALVSLMAWSGYAPFGNMYGQIENVSDTYFGFQSLIVAMQDLPTQSPLDIIVACLNEFQATVADFQEFLDSWGDGWQWYEYVIQAINFISNATQVAWWFIATICEIIGAPILWFLSYVVWFAKILGGYYNMPLFTSY